MVRALKIILPQSTSVRPEGMPNIPTFPPIISVLTICSNAAGLPLISKPISNPSCMPTSAITSCRSSSKTLTGRTLVTLSASCNRYGLISVITMLRAPAKRATAAAIMPIGPAPVISTSSPTTSNESTVCTAFPSGSKMAPMSNETSSGNGTTLNAGITKYSANAPGRVTPTPIVSGSR